MGRYLLILLGLLWLAAPSSAAGREQCLTCHTRHYAQRGGCSDCHRGNPLSDRKNIAHRMLISGRFARFTVSGADEGKRLAEQYACRRCHVIAGRGNRLSVDLDRSARRLPPEELTQRMLRPVQNMPDFRMPEPQAVLLVNYLLAASVGVNSAEELPQVVHFKDGVAGKDRFSIACGSCHRALTARLGALGRGSVGPNLSGLFSEFYPATFRGNSRWTVQALADWLKNPRSVRSMSTMRPVALTDAEFQELVSILSRPAN